jgi:AGCS family alanine or glycine:cation symporter
MRLLPPRMKAWLTAAALLLAGSVETARAQDTPESSPPAEAAAPAAAIDSADARAKELKAALATQVGARVDKLAVSVKKPDKGPANWQESVDSVMAGVNGVIASFFFYPVFESSHSAEVSANLGDEAALAAEVEGFLTQAAAEGVPLETSALTLTIPGDGVEAAPSLSIVRGGVPLAVLWLVLGAIYFTVRMGLVQLRAFGHAIRVTQGKFSDPNDHGEVSHFQALTAALSATVGLGNIAGVAIAISIGGPGATLWMILAGFLGMASKFTECTLGQMYRQQRSDGSVMGGAMYYLSIGLKERGMGGLGKFLAVMFAILCVGGSFAGGNSFQVNQSLNALQETVPFFAENRWIYGLIMTVLVGGVILGGLKRIAQVAEKVVPTMCGIYVLAALWVILGNASAVPEAFGKIVDGAFSPAAGLGGLAGVLIQGFKRAAFSNEAGVGSAAIAHSAAKTPYAVREGIVALLEPFIDTIVVCTMTALVIVITGAYDPATADGLYAPYLDNANGAGLTSAAFGSQISWFPYILSVAVVLFAFSTMISWSYYGERCFVWLFGDGASLLYKAMFLVFVFLGSIITATQVLEFGDLMILGMAFPNVLGVVLLSGKVKSAFQDYWGKLQSGEIRPYDPNQETGKTA